MRRKALKLFAAAVLLAFASLAPGPSEALDPFCSCDRCTGPDAWTQCRDPYTGYDSNCNEFVYRCYLTEPPPVGPVGPTPPR